MQDPRPEWLRPFALVRGSITAAPLDLAQRMESVYRRIQNAGWRIVVKSIGTDFGRVPIPRAQPIELYLHRRETFTASDAQSALDEALRSAGLGYSPGGAWLGEIVDEVLAPTLRTIGGLPSRATTSDPLVWLLIGGIAAVVIFRSR